MGVHHDLAKSTTPSRINDHDPAFQIALAFARKTRKDESSFQGSQDGKQRSGNRRGPSNFKSAKEYQTKKSLAIPLSATLQGQVALRRTELQLIAKSTAFPQIDLGIARFKNAHTGNSKASVDQGMSGHI